MFNKFKKIKKVILLIFLVSVSFVTTLYADPDPGLCPNPLDPFELINCGDIDLPIDNSLNILMGLTVIVGFYMLRKKGVVREEI